MSDLGPREMAEVLTVQAGEMLRIWRLARHSVQPDRLPGLSDAPLQAFFGALGPLLGRQAPPVEAAGALSGLVRLPPAGADGALAEEWEVARQVLRAACDSLGAGPTVKDWLDQAAQAGSAAVQATAHREAGAPAGLVRLLVFAGLALRPKAT